MLSKQELFSFIDTLADEAISLERGLTQIPAIAPETGGEGELKKCLFLENYLREHGLTELRRIDAPDKRVPDGVRPNLLAYLPCGAASGPALWVISHLDVVPPGERSLWTSDPWTAEVREGRVYGRGVEDNQQGLVSSILAALTLKHCGITPSHPVKLLFAADEENGSAYGVDFLVKSRSDVFAKGDMALVPDSGSSDGGDIEIAEKNQLWLKVTTQGVQAHASRPDLGKNASFVGSYLATNMQSGLYARFAGQDEMFQPPYSTFEVTKKEANVPNINTIPAKDVFYMDMRFLPRYSVGMIMEECRRYKTRTEDKYKVKITLEIVQKAESKATSPDCPLVQALSREINDVYGVESRCVGIGGGTVAAMLRKAGLDCACWCKIDERAHEPNEYAVIANILDDAKVMAALMSDM
jgi:succinyl-diaminopimelate desuccinylase